MDTYLYLSLIPESLVASMLEPEKFGTYLATGTQKRSRGQAIYFDLKNDFQSDDFDLASVPRRCVAHPDGRPKHSVYLAIYRVLEHIPLSAVQSLWLATKDGRVLQLKQSRGSLPKVEERYHLYQELCPVNSLIASTLAPQSFAKFITEPSRPVFVPRICFVDFELADLADNPLEGQAKDLPYPHLDHLRDCLIQLHNGRDKHTKTVNRIQPQELMYRCIKSGFYLGDQSLLLYFPFPSHEELDSRYHEWWRSANVI